MTDLVTTIIKPKGLMSLDLGELWQYRELFYIFSWRDIKVRYKQTLLGIAWAVFQPIVSMLIFSFFFGKLAGMPSGKLPYPVFVYVGLVIWTFFSNALSHASTSLIENSQMIKKIYFPRLVIPLSAIITCLVDLSVTVAFLLFVTLFYKVTPSPLLLFFVPVLVSILLLTASGLGMFLAAVNIKYRDVRYILPFFIQILMFLTPVIYPSTIVAEKHKWILILNPLTSVIETTRELISGGVNIEWPLLLFSFVWSIALFVFGLYYFRKTERFFADVA